MTFTMRSDASKVAVAGLTPDVVEDCMIKQLHAAYAGASWLDENGKVTGSNIDIYNAVSLQ